MITSVAALKLAYRDLQRRAVYCGDHRVLTMLNSGHKIYVDSRDLSLAPHIIMHGHWEPTTTQVVQRLVKAGMRVIDVGANVGYYSLLMAQAIGPQGKLVAFEANPVLAKLVQANLAINGFALGSGISQVISKAASNFTGSTKFTVFESYMGGSTVFENDPQPGDTAKRIDVACVTLDEQLKDFGPVDFIKIDAEGSEKFILEGARRIIKSSPNLKMIIEFQPEKPLYDLVSEHGFKVCPILPDSSAQEMSFSELQNFGTGDALLTR